MKPAQTGNGNGLQGVVFFAEWRKFVCAFFGFAIA
ncbi:MAG: hypothetical protein BWX95_01421 [Bacteroidetes bacterium ADurb.Bin141]|nr:MAG: hypothetical protein BWX95_01421 [Bacteroidetes bacterium ADurb.Bin141]